MSTFVSFWNPSTKLPFSICYLFHAPPQKYFGAYYVLTLGFPSDSVAQNLPAMQEPWETGSIPGSGRFPGGRHSNPLQYSFLENPMDRGTWQAAVHRIAKNQTWLKQLFIHTYTYFTLNISTYFISSLHIISILAANLLVASHSRPRIKMEGLWGLLQTG